MTRRDAVLFVLAAALSACTIWQGIGPHDEGLMLQAAHRIASGELPYRDFWWNYGPGQPLLLAPFDRSLEAWRVIRVLLDATVALLAYRLARREVARAQGRARAQRRGQSPSYWGDSPVHVGGTVPVARSGDTLALLAWAAVAGAMAFPTGPGPNPAALALGLGGILLAPKRPVAGGALTGLAAIFRIEVGAAAAIGAALSARSPKPLAAGAVVGLAGWLPFFVAAPEELLDQTVGFLAIQDMQRLPFPLNPDGIGLDPNKLLEFYMPLILVIGAALAAATRKALAFAPLALAGLLYLLGRTDEFHLVPLAAILPIMLVAAAAQERRRALRLALLAVTALIAVHGIERQAGQLLHLGDLEKIDGVYADATEVRDIEAVRAATRTETIFVAPPRFDRVTVGNPLLYVLAKEDNPTRHDVIQPGVVTEADTQREMIADLERAKPEYLVRWHDPRTAPEDNPSGTEQGAKLLDRYLARRYGPSTRRYGVYRVNRRRR